VDLVDDAGREVSGDEFGLTAGPNDELAFQIAGLAVDSCGGFVTLRAERSAAT